MKLQVSILSHGRFSPASIKGIAAPQIYWSSSEELQARAWGAQVERDRLDFQKA